MLISHKHKFITIDIPKTGTTSVNCSLIPLLGNDDIFSFPPKEQYNLKYVANSISDLHRHAHYEEVITKFPECNQYFTFCFFRNPWERIISFHKWLNGGETKKGFIKYKGLPLKDLIISEIDALKPQVNWIKNNLNSSKRVSVFKFENLQQDFNKICDKIGIPQQRLPHKNATKHKRYTEYYDDETREIVAQKYAKDIEMFKYKFEDEKC